MMSIFLFLSWNLDRDMDGACLFKGFKKMFKDC